MEKREKTTAMIRKNVNIFETESRRTENTKEKLEKRGI
jgi:hypothetical protein